MTVLKALAILEAALLECKQRNVDTPEVREALDFLEPHIRPTWLIPQYRHALDGHGGQGYDREGQQQVPRPSFESAMHWGCVWISWRESSPLLTT